MGFNMTLDERQKEIVEAFETFDDWTEKYEYIIEMGKHLPLIGNDKKTDEYLVKGCQSQVWVDAKMNGDVMEIFADSDALITSGIIAIIIRVMNMQKPETLLNTDFYFLRETGLVEHLSMNRSNGLVAMLDKIKEYARQFANA
jgi:cysteine desulfuration protein SufE